MNKVFVALAALFAVVVITVSVTDTEKPDGTHERNLTVHLGGPGHKEVTLPPAAQQIAESQEAQDRAGHEIAAEADLKTELPQASAPATLKRNAPKTPPGQPKIPLHLPLASASVPGCRSYPVRNYGNRNGKPVLIGVTHWTASRDTFPSWSGILGNVRWFDQLAAQASSSEIMDSGGQCALVVAEARKPYTQTNYNGYAVSVEITNNGSEKPLVRAAGLKALARLYVGWHDRWGIPLRRGRVEKSFGSRCPTVYVSGILEHVDLGVCGGGHPDVAHDPQVDAAIRLAVQTVAARAKPTAAQLAVRSHKILHAKIRARCHVKPRPGGCAVLYDRLGKLHAKYRNLPT